MGFPNGSNGKSNPKKEKEIDSQNSESNLELEKKPEFVEWKSCNEIITKFDGILIDLRKYGFTVATGLMTAGSFFGLQSFAQFEPFQIVIIFATMALIDVLYWLDVYYQTILTAVILRTQVLEKRLSFGVDTYISRFYMRHRIGKALHILYIGFLVSLAIIGGYVVHVNDLVITSKVPFPIWILFLILPIIFVFCIWYYFDRTRYKTYSDAQMKISNFIRKSWILKSNENLDQDIFEFLDSDKEELGIDLDIGEWVDFDITGSCRLLCKLMLWSRRLIVTNKRVYGVKTNPLTQSVYYFDNGNIKIKKSKKKNNILCILTEIPSEQKLNNRNSSFEILISPENYHNIENKINEMKNKVNSASQTTEKA